MLSSFGVTALGPYSSALSGDGETIELRRADGTVADTVTYKDTFPWPIAADGEGASMELINPELDNDLGSSWRSSAVPGVLPEATLIPTSDTGWRWRPGDTEASSPTTAWTEPGFVEDVTWIAQAMPIGFGNVGPSSDRLLFSPPVTGMQGNHTSLFLRNEFTVAPGEIPPALQLRIRADDGAVIWINGEEVHRENVLAGALSIASSADGSVTSETAWVEVEITGVPAYLNEGANTIAIQLFNSSTGSSDCGMDFELIRPATGVGAPPIPTPGATNSTFATNAAPAIRQVDHSPEQPAGDEPVLITAKVTDPDGVASVALEVQTVAPGAYIPAFLAKPSSQLFANPTAPRTPNPAYLDPANWEQINMLDDGTGGDVTAGDGVFTASLAGRPHRTLVRYRITVIDSLGAASQVPYPDDASLNFAYFAYDGVPDYTAGTRSVLGAPHTYSANIITSVPVYHVITTPGDFDQAVGYNGADRIERNNYDARSAYNWSGTFVHEGEVFDNIAYRLRQRNARYSGSGKRSFKFRFHRGHYPTFRDMDGNKYPSEWKFLASHKMRSSRGNYTWGLEQAANHILWNMTGTPAPFTHWFNMRVIRGEDEAPAGNNGQYLGDHYGLLLAMEEYDTRFLDSHGLEKGNLYKLISGRTDGVSVRRYLAPIGVDDGSDFQNIIFQLRPNKDDAWLHSHVNYDSWNRYHLICDAVRHYDVAPNTAEHLKNRAYYFEPSASNPLGRLNVLPWDSDTSWGPNWNGGEDFCKQAIHGTGGNSPRPEFIKEYNNFAREFRDLIWTEEQISLLLDPLVSRIADIVPADRDRWISGVGGSDSLPAIEPVVADMKKFAFLGGSWVGGDGPREAISKDSGISGQQGRDAYLDALAADSDIPETPTIAYTGDAGFPQDGLAFQSSAFADPNGSGTFGTMEWRIAQVTPIGGGSEEILARGSEWRYLDDGSDQGTAWRASDFDDSNWSTGNTPAGYGGINGFPVLGTTIDFGGDTGDRHITTYFRTTFDIDDPSLLDRLDFETLVDDGAIVYINGHEVYREGFSAGANVGFDTVSESNGNETNYDDFAVTDTSILVPGENSLAVEVHQRSPTSSDMGFEINATATLALIAPGQAVNFEWAADWESGEITPFTASVTPPGSAASVGNTYRARVRHSDNTGRWSHWSAPLEFTVSAPSIQPWLDGLVISELMYHPAPPSAAELGIDPTLSAGDFEWLEIANVGPTPLDLTDIRLTKGVDFDFVTGTAGTIAPGERLVVVSDEAAFNLRYGHAVTPDFVVGTFERSLSDGGEQVKLSFGAGTPIRDFVYNDKHPWPEAADGDGPSLTLRSPSSLPDHTLPENWRASASAGGSPGADDATMFVGDPLGDDNGDGVSNLVAYAVGTQQSGSIVIVDGLAYPAISFDLNTAAEDVSVSVEMSTDLTIWTATATEFVESTYTGPGQITQTWRSTTPVGDGAVEEFLRVRVQMP